MLKSIFALLILALAVDFASAAQGAANAQSEAAEADRLNAQVVKLYGEGKYDEALPLAQRVLELREKALGGEDLKVAYALTNLGNIHVRKGGAKEAELLFTRALAVVEKRGGAETDFAAELHTQLGLLRVDAGKYKEGEPHLQRVLAIKEKVHGADSRRIVPALLNLADVNFLRDRAEQAHALLGRALDILGRQPGTKDAGLAERLKKYYCPLTARGREDNKELTEQLGKVIWKLEAPTLESGKKIAKGEVLNGHAVSKPQPTYSNAAKEQKLSGVVVVLILVDEAGYVVKAEPYCGHPILAKSAVEAARKARFTPTLVSGQPVKVSGFITYNFVLE